MKKLLLGTAVLALGAAYAAGPAQAADGIKLDLAGHMKGYLSWIDQDTTPNDPATPAVDESEDTRSLDILRETEIHFTGETTLDNGLTVGVHTEVDMDGSDSDDATDSLQTEESYAYFSGAWGRVNFGAEDGAAYLLQVAAPSADANVDGLRTYIAGTNYDVIEQAAAAATDNTIDDLFNGTTATSDLLFDRDNDDLQSIGDTLVGANFASVNFGDTFRFDYDQAISGANNKLTYLSPVFNGFQAGASYTPKIGSAQPSRDWAVGNNADDVDDVWGSVWDLAARFEGQFSEVGVILGGGWSHAELEGETADTPVFFERRDGNNVFNAGVDRVIAHLDDREAWNVGLDLNWGAFGLGTAYTEDDMGVSGSEALRSTWIVGLDYTTGPYKLGASYYDQNQDLAQAEFDTTRWTGGVVYTYGPGMTFRGSVSFTDHDEDFGITSDSFDSTNVLFGTQIDF